MHLKCNNNDDDGIHKKTDDRKEDEDEDEDELSLQLACSRPCSECIKIIRALRIKSVIYVNDDNELVNESPDNIECTVHSGGTLGIIERRITWIYFSLNDYDGFMIISILKIKKKLNLILIKLYQAKNIWNIAKFTTYIVCFFN